MGRQRYPLIPNSKCEIMQLLVTITQSQPGDLTGGTPTSLQDMAVPTLTASQEEDTFHHLILWEGKQ